MATEGKNSKGTKVSERIKNVFKKITKNTKKIPVEEPIHGTLEEVMKSKKDSKKGKSTENKADKPKKSFRDTDFFKKLKAKLNPNKKSKVEDLYSTVNKTTKVSSSVGPESAKGSKNPPPVPPKRYSVSGVSSGAKKPPAVAPKPTKPQMPNKDGLIYAALDWNGKTATTQKTPVKRNDSVIYADIAHTASRTKDVIPKERPRNPPPPVPVRGDLHSIALQSQLPNSVKQSSSSYTESKGNNAGKGAERNR